ncbi:MAG: serine/threonine-protein kinase [Planctomycetaceae bacterium]
MSSNSEALAPLGREQMIHRRIGRYELEKELGSGGMGAVYLAKDTQLKRLVALKVLPPDKAENSTLVKRFQAEAQAAAQLRHDNIVSIYDNGEADGHLYIAMEFVDGYDVQELIRKRGKIPVKRSIEIIKQVAQALQHAAIHKIIHRDIKPSNLLIRNDGVVKLVDLGLARSIDDTLESNITRAGTTVGTVDYMSPEQARNSRLADTRSDIYSLGCTWYHMLTGQPPYPVGSMTNKLQAHASAPLANPIRLNDAVPEALVAVMQRMMAKSPEDRYQTPSELLADLEQPSLTQDGMVQELMSEVAAEEDHPTRRLEHENRPVAANTRQPDEIAHPAESRARNKVPQRHLPPKKKLAESELLSEDDRPALDWETLQPFVWGLGILATITLLGLLIASFSGNLGPDSLPYAPPDVSVDAMLPEEPKVIAAPEGQALTTGAPPVAETTDAPPADDPGPPEEPATDEKPLPVVKVPAGLRSFDAATVPNWVGPPAKAKLPRTNAVPLDFGGPSGAKSAGALGWHHTAAADRGASWKDLSQDLSAIPASGGTLLLSGSGPFSLPMVRLQGIQHLKLAPVDGQSPVIVLSPKSGETNAGLSLSQGSLELERLHFVLDRSSLSDGEAVKMIEVLDGPLKVNSCTFSVWGATGPEVTAIQFGSQAEFHGTSSVLEPRLLLDQVFIRGERVTALALDRLTADVVVRDSLLASGSAPVVRIGGTLPAKLPDPPASQSHRALRFLQSTLFSRQAIVDLAGDGAASPPATSLVFQQCVCATNSQDSASSLLQARGWPFIEPEKPSMSKPVRLDWLMKNSLALGFGTLASFDDGFALPTADGSAWQRLWSQASSLDQLSPTRWPAQREGDLSDLSPATIDRQSLVSLNVLRADDPQPPGCDVTGLPNPEKYASRQRLTALKSKPRWTEPVTSPSTPPIVQIDLATADLGVALKNGNWPAGTVIEVLGTGQKPTTPVELNGKSWRIVGHPEESQSLVLTPLSTGPELPGLLTIQNGSLELENLRFQISVSQKVTVKSLFAAKNASLSLKRISAQCALANDRGLDNLVQWDSSDSTGSPPPRLACRDSFLLGSGSLFRIRGGAGDILLTNSLLVSRGDILDFEFTQPALGALVAEHVTFSATRGVFHLPGAVRPRRRLLFECTSTSACLVLRRRSKNCRNSRPSSVWPNFPGA